MELDCHQNIGKLAEDSGESGNIHRERERDVYICIYIITYSIYIDISMGMYISCRDCIGSMSRGEPWQPKLVGLGAGYTGFAARTAICVESPSRTLYNRLSSPTG